MAQFALAWVASQPGITSPIIGPRTMEQLEDNLNALDVTITDKDKAIIDKLIPPGGMAVPYYDGTESDWRPHPFRW